MQTCDANVREYGKKGGGSCSICRHTDIHRCRALAMLRMAQAVAPATTVAPATVAKVVAYTSCVP